MPYIFKEELEEGDEEALVVPQGHYDALAGELDTVTGQRDALLERAEAAESELKDVKNKYADAFITSAERIKQEQKRDIMRESSPRTFTELFREKGI